MRVWTQLISAILGTFLMMGHQAVHGKEPVVEWWSAQVTIYDYEHQATLYLDVAESRSRETTIGLLSYGVGLSVTDDAIIPDTVIIPPGKCRGSINVSLTDAVLDGDFENGYRRLRIRLNEVPDGSAGLGGSGHREAMDVNILGTTASGTGCRSGSFRTSRVEVHEGNEVVWLTFIVNEPLDHDANLGYRVNVDWTGTTSRALHRLDYSYFVSHQEAGDFKYVTLRAGDTSVDIPITIIDDDISEDTEQFMVQLEHQGLASRINILADSVIVDIVDNDRCPEPVGSQYYNGSCYFKVSLPGKSLLGANDAAGLCAEHGGHLAIIKGEVENTIASDIGDREQAWIGAIRDHWDTETFIWPDGSPLTFVSWRQREPNNRLGNEDCVKTNHVSFGLWNDTPCEGDLNVRVGVCQKPAILESASYPPVPAE